MGLSVRLWVDDLHSFQRICSEVETDQEIQLRRGVEIRQWAGVFPEVMPAELVIEAFACDLPERYVMSMVSKKNKPVWLNLEYLSAESWVSGCHCLPSPHPYLKLVKYFFFPGFTANLGGLIIEHDLLARRDEFQADVALQNIYWDKLAVPPRKPGEVRVSIFSYESPWLSALLTSWSRGPLPLTCLVPEGRILPQIAHFLGRQHISVGEVVEVGSLRVYVLPFIEQDEYDKLLWACDVNFVRGEDSCVRAQWAGKPFVWHIYPQHDGVHMKKLHALLELYCIGLEKECVRALITLWNVWNSDEKYEKKTADSIDDIWRNLIVNQEIIEAHAIKWAENLSRNNLALNLLDFSLKVGKIAPLEN
jgi:uncharacterized repeat protein (TIGR03837 family)